MSKLWTRVASIAEAKEAAAKEAAAEEARIAEHLGPDYVRPTRMSPFRIGFLGGAGLLLAYMTYLSLDTIRGTLILIAIASVLAIGLDPLVSVLIRVGIRRGWAVLMIMIGLIAVLFGAGYAIVPPIVSEVSQFVVKLPETLTNLQQNSTIKSLDEKFGFIDQIKNSNVLKDLAPGAADGIVNAGFTVAGIAFDLFVILILTMYILAGFPRIKQAAWRLAPASRRHRVSELGEGILKQMGGYLGGATLIAIQAGLVAGVFAWIVGMPYPFAIALGAAVLDFVPVIGPIIVGVSMMLIGFTQSVTIGIVAAGFYLIQHLFEAYWLYPKVMKRRVNISTGSVVVAILIGGALLGVVGALLAVPIAAAVQLMVREVVFPVQDAS